MSYGQRNNQRQQRPAPTRSKQTIEHEIDPLFEVIMNQSDKLMPFNVSGNALPTEMVRFDTPDGQGLTIEAFKAMMVTSMTFCVDFANPNYPEVRKLDTQVDRGTLHAVYKSRIFWKHSKDFWHIPGFTRYVIDARGNVKNAYNGVDIRPDQWGNYKIFSDQLWFINDKPFGADLKTLMLISQKALPSDFKDYGFRNWSHKVAYSHETKSIDLVKRPAVTIRDGNGNVLDGENLTEFGILNLKTKDIKDLREIKEENLYTGSCTGGQFTAKLKDPSLVVPVPEVVVTNESAAVSTPAVQNGTAPDVRPSTPAPQNLPTEFDDDIPF